MLRPARRPGENQSPHRTAAGTCVLVARVHERHSEAELGEGVPPTPLPQSSPGCPLPHGQQLSLRSHGPGVLPCLGAAQSQGTGLAGRERSGRRPPPWVPGHPFLPLRPDDPNTRPQPSAKMARAPGSCFPQRLLAGLGEAPSWNPDPLPVAPSQAAAPPTSGLPPQPLL